MATDKVITPESYAKTDVLGVVKLSTAAATAANPIAVGDNDPRFTRKFLVGTTASDLPGSINMGALTSGIVKQSVFAGVATPSIANLSDTAHATTFVTSAPTNVNLPSAGTLATVADISAAFTARSINTTSPLTGGGNLSVDRTIAIPQAGSTANGYLSSADWTMFNNKVPPTRTISTSAPLTGGGDLSANRTIAFLNEPAKTSLRGPVSGADAYPTFRLDAVTDQPYVHFKHGFDNQTDSTLAFNSGTRVFTIAPASTTYSVWSSGAEIVKSSPNTVTIANTVGLHFIYFDSAGTLTESTAPWDLLGTAIPVATVYWNGTTGTRDEERHGSVRNRPWHKWAHNTIGTRYASGLAGTFTNNTFSFASGVLYDEDILLTITGPLANGLAWYLNSATGKMTFAVTTTPYVSSAGVLQYDNAGTLTAVSNSYYIVNDFYGSNDLDYPIYMRVGNAQYANLSDAQASAAASWINESTAELKLLYRAIYRYQGGVISLQGSTDFRTGGTLPGGGATTIPASSVTVLPPSPFAAGDTNMQSLVNDIPTYFLQIGATEFGGSAASLKSPATTGVTQITGPAAGATRVKTVRDANDTLLELGGTYTPTGTWVWTSASVMWPTFNQSTTGSAASVKSTATTGLTQITGPSAGTTRVKTVRDADDTILELGGSYSPSALWTFSGGLRVIGTAASYAVVGSTGADTLDRGVQFLNQAGSSCGFITLVPNTTGTSSVMNFYVGGSAAGDVALILNDDNSAAFKGSAIVGGTTLAAKFQVNMDNASNALPGASGTTPAPGFRLSNTQNTSFVLDLGFVSATPTCAWIQARSASNFATNFGLLINPNGGNVGVGTTAAVTEKFAVSGTGSFSGALLINGGIRLKRTTFSNANVTGVAGDSLLVQTGTMSAPRTVTFPQTDAAGIGAGYLLGVVDESFTVSGTNTLTVTGAGSNLIGNAATEVLNTAGCRAVYESNGGAGAAGRWTRIS